MALALAATICGMLATSRGYFVVKPWLESVQNDLNSKFKMLQTVSRPMSAPGFGLFDTVPDDILDFGRGASFSAAKVPKWLALKKEDVSRLSSVSVKSVRYDEAMPEQVRERLEEIASIINMVAGAFGGDAEKTAAWFRARNPMLGDVAPRDMIRLGRYERLRKYIINAMVTRANQPQSETAVRLVLPTT